MFSETNYLADDRWTFFSVDVELTSHCGQNCLFCPRESLSRPAGFMAVAFFAKLAPQLAEFGSRITFCGMGNPLLHADLAEFGALCSEYRLNYGLTIQAPALTAANVDKILQFRPAFIEVSLPTIDPALFAKIYPEQKLENSMAGLHNLVSRRGSKRGISINSVVVAADSIPVEKTLEFWQNEGFNCRILPCHSRGGNLQRADLLKSSARRVERCGLFATHSFITWDARLLACCHDLSGATEIADLSAIPIKEAAATKRQMLLNGLNFAICNNCDEPAALRPIPSRNFPESAKAKSRFLKSHCTG